MLLCRRFGKALSCKDLDNTIASSRDNKASVLAPDNTADTFTTHDAVSSNFLCTYALVERPEANRRVMAGRDSFTTVFAEGQGGNS